MNTELGPEGQAQIMSTRIVQVLCPARHCIIAVAYDLSGPAPTEAVLRETMRANAINPWCGICGIWLSHVALEEVPL